MGYVTSLEIILHLTIEKKILGESLRTLGESLRTDAAPELPELRAGLRDWALASMPENNQTFSLPQGILTRHCDYPSTLGRPEVTLTNLKQAASLNGSWGMPNLDGCWFATCLAQL